MSLILNNWALMNLQICDKLWLDSSDLKKHMRTHAEVREKNYICDQCGEKFHRKSYLVTHRYKHTGELPFKCDIEVTLNN